MTELERKVRMHTVHTTFNSGVSFEEKRDMIGRFGRLPDQYGATPGSSALLIKPAQGKKYVEQQQVGFFVDDSSFEKFRGSGLHKSLRNKLSSIADWRDTDSYLTVPELESFVQSLQAMLETLKK